MLAASIHQRALQAALDFGQADLAQMMRGELMLSIKKSTREFKQVSGSFSLPPALVAEIDRLLATSTSTAAAIRVLSVFPGLLELDLDRLREGAREHMKEASFLSLMPTVHYHPDGKVTFQSIDAEGNVERHAAFLAGSHLVVVEALLRYVLGRLMSRMEPSTLIEALGDWPHLPAHRAVLLSVAAERFAKSDWISSAFLVIPLYEAVLRDLLRAGGYPALKTEAGGTQKDETLNSLIRSAATRSVLGDGHCDLVEHVMCDPALGWNLRNELAHGTVRPETLTPMRVFLAWLLLIRLTCFVGSAPKAEARRANADADGQEPPEPTPAAGETDNAVGPAAKRHE